MVRFSVVANTAKYDHALGIALGGKPTRSRTFAASDSVELLKYAIEFGRDGRFNGRSLSAGKPWPWWPVFDDQIRQRSVKELPRAI
jgi:hypothetical protein